MVSLSSSSNCEPLPASRYAVHPESSGTKVWSGTDGASTHHAADTQPQRHRRMAFLQPPVMIFVDLGLRHVAGVTSIQVARGILNVSDPSPNSRYSWCGFSMQHWFGSWIFMIRFIKGMFSWNSYIKSWNNQLRHLKCSVQGGNFSGRPGEAFRNFKGKGEAR